VTAGATELRLESISSRFVGGRSLTLTGQPVEEVALSSALPGYRHDGNDAYPIEQAYVQRFVPAGRIHDTPVLLVHGGGMTGACWESTPDGRPGWLTAFLRAGLPVDVLDNVERGRAGWCAAPGVWPGKPIMRGEREMWEVFRLGAPEGYDRGIPFPGSQFPVGALAAMARQGVPRWPGNAALAERSLRDVVAELGPCTLVGHSQGGGLCARVAQARPDLVRQVVLIEPHGLPDLSAVPAGYPPQLTVIGDFTELSPLWVELTADMRRHAAKLRAAGVRADLLDLPGAGIHGNSHNPMMDCNSDLVAGQVLAWLASTREVAAC
jgi:pimeloyl-ACP methyl ester carboxylesterase